MALRKLEKQARKLNPQWDADITSLRNNIAFRFPKGTISEKRFPVTARAIGPGTSKQSFQNPRLMGPRNPAPKRHTLQRVSPKKLESRQEARKRTKEKLNSRQARKAQKAIMTKGSKGPAKRRKQG